MVYIARVVSRACCVCCGDVVAQLHVVGDGAWVDAFKRRPAMLNEVGGEGAAAVGQWAPAARSALTMAECPLSSANCKADVPRLITKNIVRSKINKTK
jgi:hypothetical protein